MRRKFLLWVAGAALVASAAVADEVTVAAAASLGPALRELVPLYEAAAPGARVRLTLGASGALLQQLAAGAPVQVFASADDDTMDQAVARGLVRAAQRRVLVTNRLVVAVPANASALPRTLAEVAALSRVAIGLPASVPAGRYARAALAAAGLWPRIEPRLVGAQNARQVLDYIVRGEVDAGFVYASDLPAAAPGGRARIAFEVPTPTPIRYPVAALADAPPGAQRFVDFLLSAPARDVFKRHGLGLP